MQRSEPFQRVTLTRLLLIISAMAIVIAACTSDDSAADEMAAREEEAPTTTIQASGAEAGSAEAARAVDTLTAGEPTAAIEAKVIRNGTIDLRIEPGAFGASAVQVRTIAADLGGYVASGETQIEEVDEDRYAFGWYTIRIPSDRFDEAVTRVEQLGERVSASLSSQDVTEEYVDLEGRLAYWKDQEAFYRRLMAEATTIDDLITVQTQMQEVLLTIEQIEGRLRYLDSRTVYATLTVGLTEVPGSGPVPPPVDGEPGPIAEAFEQAGAVLLATVSFVIVSAAVAVPLAIVAIMLFVGYRIAIRVTRTQPATESDNAV